MPLRLPLLRKKPLRLIPASCQTKFHPIREFNRSFRNIDRAGSGEVYSRGHRSFRSVLHHRSEVVEAGKVRKLEFDFNAVSYGALARRLNGMEIGAEIQFKGFLAPKSMRTRRLTVHITEFK